jgi:hypothetical protein
MVVGINIYIFIFNYIFNCEVKRDTVRKDTDVNSRVKKDTEKLLLDFNVVPCDKQDIEIDNYSEY